MKWLETAPQRYDWGISFLTFGRINKLRRLIVDNYIESDDKVLDIGCGTGTLSLLCAEKADNVVGIDSSGAMLKVGEQRRSQTKSQGRTEFVNMNAIEIEGRFSEKQFDKIVSTLLLSELSEQDRHIALKGCAKVIKDKGFVCFADEVVPQNWLFKLLFHLLRSPFSLITYLLTQRTTGALCDIEGDIKKAGFKIIKVHCFLFGTMKLVVASKRLT